MDPQLSPSDAPAETTNPLRQGWAYHLDSQRPMFAKNAVKYDDLVVHALFQQYNRRPPHRAHHISTMSVEAPSLTLEQSAVFIKLFEAARNEWFQCEQLSEFTAKAAAFIKGLEPWILAVVPEKDSRKPISWFTKAYAILLAPWSAVRLRVCALGPQQKVQFAIFAQANIPADAFLWELSGALSKDDEKNTHHTHLSEMAGYDGRTTRILYGPIRLVNHSCKPNATYHALPIVEHGRYKRDSSHSITIKAVRDIRIGEEITVNYGEAMGESYFADLNFQWTTWLFQRRAMAT
ncbi:hypothetical protein FB451DRAFT_1324664 [Mycena latifolia]|nr:hypothetical protein FB451DRAFT_1324664 [Mycena latifolia]